MTAQTDSKIAYRLVLILLLAAAFLPTLATAQYPYPDPDPPAPPAPTPTPSEAIAPGYQGENGVLAQVFETNCLGCHSSTRTGAQRNGAPAGLNWDVYETARDFGDRIVVRAVQLQTMPPAFSGVPALNEEQRQALLAWQDAGYPLQAAGSVPQEVSYFDNDNLRLVLPVVIVGDKTYRAELNLRADAQSPTRYAFELASATLTGESSDMPVEYDPATGLVTIPRVERRSGGSATGQIYSAEMQFVQGSNPLYFRLTVLTPQ